VDKFVCIKDFFIFKLHVPFWNHCFPILLLITRRTHSSIDIAKQYLIFKDIKIIVIVTKKFSETLQILKFYLIDLMTYKFVPFEPFGRSY